MTSVGLVQDLSLHAADACPGDQFPVAGLAAVSRCVFAFFRDLFGDWASGTAQRWSSLIYGLLMGAGASVNKMWQVKLGQALGKKRYQALGKQPFYIYVCAGLTFSYFTVAVTCLWVDMAQLEGLSARLGVSAGGRNV